MTIKKLYCYVDESGQDTLAQKGREPLFVVAVVILEKQREELSQACQHYEEASGKHKDKWGRAGYEERLRYLRLVFADERFEHCLRYSTYKKAGKSFDTATIQTIARAILWRKPNATYTANVYVDGLAKTKRPAYRRALKQLGVSMGEIKGIRKDESNSFVRLADAIAGFVRDGLANNEEVKNLFIRAKRKGGLVEV